MPVEPTQDQLRQLLEDDRDTPVVMLNLLRFKEDAGSGGTGADSYRRYGDRVASHLARVGAEVVWRGRCDQTVIGPDDERWDLAILVRYPSRKAFIEMVSKDAYRDVAKDRSAALVDSRLVAMTES